MIAHRGSTLPETPRTLYEILGVGPDATKPDIERAYLAAKNARGRDSRELWDLERAYVTLCDPNAKRKYDSDSRDLAATSAVRLASKLKDAVPAEKRKPQTPDVVTVPRTPVAIALLLVFVLVLWKVF